MLSHLLAEQGIREMSMAPAFPPGPKGLPFVGSLFDLEWQPLHFQRELQHRYGTMATIHIGKRRVLFVFRPEHIRYCLIENPRNFVKLSIATGQGLKPILGDGLLTIDGEMHRQQRKLVQPAFHKHRVDSYAHTMTQFTQEMLDHWQLGAVINMSSEIRQLTLRIITKTLFDVDSLQQMTLLGQAFDVLTLNSPIQGIIFGRFGSRRRSAKTIEASRIIDTFVYDIIAQRRTGKKDTGDMLSMLLAAQEEGATLTDKQIHDHVLTFITA